MNAANAKSLNTRTASLHSPEVRKAASTFDNLPDSGYIRQSQLIPDVVPFSSATLWRKCKNGTFVSPVRLGARVTAWNVGLVRAWLIAQAKAVQS
jgi:predicted DNA-binding transcriptional regulator AlpA